MELVLPFAEEKALLGLIAVSTDSSPMLIAYRSTPRLPANVDTSNHLPMVLRGTDGRR